MAHMSNEDFLRQLSVLYMQARDKGPKSVYVYMKPYDGRTKPLNRNETEQGDEIHGLFRAKLGNKRISTVVKAKDVNKFHHAYVGVLRTNLANLQKAKDEKAPQAS